MANFTKGYTIDFGTYVTADVLHSLIEDALITNVTASDLADGFHITSVGTATPNPSIYPLWFSTDPLDPVLRVFARPWNIWLAVGPDRFEIPLINSAGTTARMGSLVCATGHSNFCLQSNPTSNMIGFLQATTASGAVGPVAVCGIGWVLHLSSTSGSASPDPSVGGGLRAYGCPAGGVASIGLGSNGGSGPIFGQFLEGNRSGASGSGSVFRAMIYGPMLTTLTL